MTKASDNKYPKVLMDLNTSSPTAPGDASWKMYAKADGVYARSSNSEVGPFGAAASTTVVPAHGCLLKRSSGDFSVGNNTFTAIQFNAEDYDTDTMHDTGSNTTRITIPSISGVTTGLWTFSAWGYVDLLTKADVRFIVGGSTTFGFNRCTGDGATLTAYHLTAQAVLSATNYVECQVRTPTGSGNVVYDSAGSPYFSASFLGKVT